jgi:hypothetical protein
MDIHKPKPWHGWREFLKEYAIIVVGVLTALAADQLAEGVRESHTAAEARRNVRAEAQLNLKFIRERLDVQPCIDARLDALAELLGRAGDGAVTPAPKWLGHPPTAPFFVERWHAATASGRNSLFHPDEQAGYDNLYGLFERYNEHQTHEQRVWADLRMLETWRGPLGPAARLALSQDLQQARYEAWDLKYAGTFALGAGAALGLRPPGSSPGPASICVPIDTPRNQALQRLKPPYGEP